MINAHITVCSPQTLISSWRLEEMRKMLFFFFFLQQLQSPVLNAALLTLLGAILHSALQFWWWCWYDFLPVNALRGRILIIWTNRVKLQFLNYIEGDTCLERSSTLWFRKSVIAQWGRSTPLWTPVHDNVCFRVKKKSLILLTEWYICVWTGQRRDDDTEQAVQNCVTHLCVCVFMKVVSW